MNKNDIKKLEEQIDKLNVNLTDLYEQLLELENAITRLNVKLYGIPQK